MKIIVTGGSGYLGTHVRHFFEADDFSRRATGHNILGETDCAMLAEYDAVIHLAAFLDKSPESAAECFRVNAEGTARVLRAMRPGAAFVYASTKDVYGPHAANYDEVPEGCPTFYKGQTALEWSKLMGEQYAQFYGAARGLRTCIFRLSTVYAPVTPDNEYGFVGHYADAVQHGLPLLLPAGGTPVRDLLHVDDFARACRAFLDSQETAGLYNLGGGRDNALSLRSLAETIARLLDAAPVIDEDARLPAPVPLNYVSDLTKIQADLGWQPQMSVEEGLRTLL
jgi:nucleoside-diphosphate-sugar epimerase